MPTERVQRRIDSLLDQAEVAVDARDWASVREISLSVLVADPENADAQTFLAMAEPHLGDSELAAPQQNSSPTSAAPSESSAPASFANGRYEVKELLGEGGKKKVYLAHDLTLDRDVAFGLIKAEGLDADSRQRITREAQAMARLGDHPNLMPIFDLGEEAGQPYMVQPLMIGGDVGTLIEHSEDGRLALEDALRISGEICSGLEFAHGKGIIHRDLKPGNVWLTDPSTGSGLATARIGDFGLAITLDRSRLTQEKMMVGTVSYMPPEQATGGEITAQADLYSLGAMLYEMITGRPPFMGDDDIAIIGQHINTPPVEPSWHNQLLPRTLDSLVMRLLAKDPSERPQSAEEVQQALSAIDPSDAVIGREEEQGSLDAMAGGVFVGRHREMDQLKAVFEDTLGGHGKMVALVGEPGIGKTRTAQELATYASMRGGIVLWGRCYEGGGTPPYYPWVQAIRSYVTDKDAETVRREMGSSASVISEIVPDVKERLPDLQPAPQIDDPESARFRLFDSVTTFLKTASASQPIVLMLEDLHWSDKPSLMLLEFVARELGNSRLMIVGNYRDMELNRRHSLSITLGELNRERLFQRVLLRGLQKHDVQRFIEVAAGIDPPSGLVDAVHRQTEGNPLFVTETVRLLIQEGDIASGGKSDGRTSSWEIRIPEGVREVIGRRLDRISERANNVLALAAVVGRDFRLGALERLAEDTTEGQLLDVLDEALNARIVEELSDEVGHYQFTHALMQETLTSEISLNRRVRLHARIAETLEQLYGEEADAHAAELAHHFSLGATSDGDDNLVKYSIVAGEQALGLYAHEDSLRHFQNALEARSDKTMDDQMANLLFGMGRGQVAMAQVEQAIGNFRKAFDYFVQNGNTEEAVAVAGIPLGLLVGRLEGATQLIEDALSLVDQDSYDAGRLLAQYGSALYFQNGDYEGSQRAYNRAFDIASREGDKRLELQTLSDASFADVYDLRSDPAIEKSQRAIQLLETVEDPLAEIIARYTAAVAWISVGDLDRADDHARRSMVPAQRLRNRLWLGRALAGNLFLAVARGDWETARLQYDAGLESSPTGEEARLLVPRMMLEYELGNGEAGEALLERMVDLVVSTSAGPTIEHSWTAASIQLVAQITDVPDALDISERSAEIVMNSSSVAPFAEAFARTGLGLLAIKRGDSRAISEHYDHSSTINGLYIWLAHGDRIRGVLAAAMGEHGKATDHYEAALKFCRNGGFRPEQARTCHNYAEMLLDRNAAGDREKATELQDEAIAIATELGMKPLLERVLAQRETLQN